MILKCCLKNTNQHRFRLSRGPDQTGNEACSYVRLESVKTIAADPISVLQGKIIYPKKQLRLHQCQHELI